MLKPAEPANMIGNLAFGIPVGMAIVAVGLYLTIVGAPTTRAKLTVAAVVVLILGVETMLSSWAWPFVTPFEAMRRRCWHCGWDLLHRYTPCPRCAAPPKPVPKIRAGRVISAEPGE
jgi:hypothetical protein